MAVTFTAVPTEQKGQCLARPVKKKKNQSPGAPLLTYFGSQINKNKGKLS